MSASPTAPRSSHCAQLHYLPRCDTIRSPKHDYLGRHRALTIVAPTLTIVEIRSLLLGTFVDDKRADELMMCVCAICSIGDRRKCVWRWYWIIRRCACLFFVCGKPRVATRNTPPAPGWVLGALAIGPSTPGFSNSRIRAPPPTCIYVAWGLVLVRGAGSTNVSTKSFIFLFFLVRNKKVTGPGRPKSRFAQFELSSN